MKLTEKISAFFQNIIRFVATLPAWARNVGVPLVAFGAAVAFFLLWNCIFLSVLCKSYPPDKIAGEERSVPEKNDLLIFRQICPDPKGSGNSDDCWFRVRIPENVKPHDVCCNNSSYAVNYCVTKKVTLPQRNNSNGESAANAEESTEEKKVTPYFFVQGRVVKSSSPFSKKPFFVALDLAIRTESAPGKKMLEMSIINGSPRLPEDGGPHPGHPDGMKSNIPDPQMIHWHEYKGMAKSNEILSINRDKGIFLKVSQPTSTASLVSWLKSNWNFEYKSLSLFNISENANINKDNMDKIVASELEKMLQKDWSDLDTRTAVICLRILNGEIQFCTVWFFFMGIGFILASWCDLKEDKGLLDVIKDHFGVHNYLHAGVLSTPFDWEGVGKCWVHLRKRLTKKKIPKDEKERENYRKDLEDIAGSRSVIRVFFAYATEAARHPIPPDRSFLNEFSRSLIDSERKKQDNTRFRWAYFIGSLAGIGFLGTVWGIGLALMGTASVLSDEIAKQQSGVSDISLALGTAFDTTLVALFLSLIASFIVAYFINRQNQLIIELEDLLIKITALQENTYASQAGQPKPSSSSQEKNSQPSDNSCSGDSAEAFVHGFKSEVERKKAEAEREKAKSAEQRDKRSTQKRFAKRIRLGCVFLLFGIVGGTLWYSGWHDTVWHWLKAFLTQGS